MEISVDTHELQRYAETLRRAAAEGPKFTAAIINNIAFGARAEALEYMPTVMHVRNKAFLASTLLVRKASSTSQRAEFHSHPRARFSAYVEQEFGGVMQRHPATLAARGGNETGVMQKSARLGGDIITPEDIQIAHASGGDDQRVAVMLSQLQRGYVGTGKGGQRFIMHSSAKWPHPGLKRLGKAIPGVKRKRVSGRSQGAKRNASRQGYVELLTGHRPGDRQIIGLQQFDAKGKAPVKRTPWMWVSVKRYLAHPSAIEHAWADAMRHMMSGR